MSNLVKSPPFLFTYWNQFEKDSLAGSWFDYVKNTSLAKYTADSVGRYIQQASADQISAIDSTGRRICGALYSGFADLQEELEKATKELQGVNQRLNLVLDEARTSNLLQENMAELLRIPDSQKQRQHHIEMALKFLKNALKDEDLYQDALRELLEAEKLMHTDYFVLHRIGMIYLYVPVLGNLEKAVDYFSRAGKYASVESQSDAARLINILNKKVNKRFAEQAEPPSADVSALAAESFLQAGTALYALGRFDEAAKLAEKALKCQPSEAKHYFFFAKYLTRSGNPEAAIPQLEKATELLPAMALAALGDCDLNQARLVLDLLNRLNETVGTELRRGITVLEGWPRDDYRFADVQKWINDAQNSLTNGNYPQKRFLASKLQEHEANLSFAPKLVQMAAFGIEFDQALARQLLRDNKPDHVRKLWANRRQRNRVVDARLKEIAAKPHPEFLDLVLLATAVKSCFLPAGTILWKADIESSSANIAIGLDGNIYAGVKSKVLALNGSSGKQLWEFDTRMVNHSFPAIGSDGTVYVGTSNLNTHDHLVALNRETGKELWKAKENPTKRDFFGKALDDVFSGLDNYPAIGNDGTIYANSITHICAFDGQTGKRQKTFATEDILKRSSPAVGSNGIVYAAADKKVLAFDLQTGKKLWEFEIKAGKWGASPAIGANGIIYVGSEKRIVFALDGLSGKKVWEFQTEGAVTNSPIIGQNGTVYVGTEDNKCNCLIYALHGQTGEKLWSAEGGGWMRDPVVANDGTIYVVGDQSLRALDGETGETLWKYKPADKEETVLGDLVIGSDGTIYFVSEDKIFAMATASSGLADSSWPIRGQNAQRTGCAAKPQNTPPATKEQAQEIKRIMAEASAAEAAEATKWFKKKDFTRARELYAQAAALGSKDATQRLKDLPK